MKTSDVNGILTSAFEACARHRADAIAIIEPNLSGSPGSDRQLTFGALKRSADALATELAKYIHRPETIVGICLPNGIDFAMAMVAVMKAGGVCLAITPDQPIDRVASILCQTACSIIVSDDAIRPKLDEVYRDSLTIIDATAIAERCAPSTRCRHNRSLHCDQLAVVCLTSGTSGDFKAVMHSHRSLALRPRTGGLALDPKADRLFLASPLDSVIFVGELFRALSGGLSIVMYPPNRLVDVAVLACVIMRHRVSSIRFVPALLRLFLETPQSRQCNTLRSVVCSGESLPPDLVAAARRRLGAIVYSVYGTSETGGTTIKEHVETDSEDVADIVNIGKPSLNTVSVINRHGDPVAIGETGEIVVAGAIARGYLNRPGMTAAAFVPDSAGTGGRRYRTGDSGRFLANGDLVFLGRNDNQIQLYGHRIELDAIAAGLLTHPDILNAVVLASDSRAVQRSLKAFIVTADDVRLSVDAVKSHLRHCLPDVMVPAHIVFLEALPLNAAGKVDRRALAAGVV